MASEHVTNVTDANFEAEVLNSSVPVLVDFWATWCAPCKAIAPQIEALAAEQTGKLKVVKLDIDHNRAVASKFGISSIPTLLVFKGGQVVQKKVGASGGLPGLRQLVGPSLG
jgi:thioredoxin 1